MFKKFWPSRSHCACWRHGAGGAHDAHVHRAFQLDLPNGSTGLAKIEEETATKLMRRSTSSSPALTTSARVSLSCLRRGDDSVFAAPLTIPSLTEMALTGQLVCWTTTSTTTRTRPQGGVRQGLPGRQQLRGPDGEYHVYGIPLLPTYAGGSYFYDRKDLADKYGVTVTDKDGVNAYWERSRQRNRHYPLHVSGLPPTPLTGIVESLYRTPRPSTTPQRQQQTTISSTATTAALLRRSIVTCWTRIQPVDVRPEPRQAIRVGVPHRQRVDGQGLRGSRLHERTTSRASPSPARPPRSTRADTSTASRASWKAPFRTRSWATSSPTATCATAKRTRSASPTRRGTSPASPLPARTPTL